MDFAQLGGRERRDAVCTAERLQFIPGVDAPLLGSGLYQRRFRVLVLAKEDLTENLRKHHDEGQFQ